MVVRKWWEIVINGGICKKLVFAKFNGYVMQFRANGFLVKKFCLNNLYMIFHDFLCDFIPLINHDYETIYVKCQIFS